MKVRCVAGRFVGAERTSHGRHARSDKVMSCDRPKSPQGPWNAHP